MLAGILRRSTVLIACFAFGAPFIFDGALASQSISGFIDLRPFKSRLTFATDGGSNNGPEKPIAITVSDPRKKSEVEKILIDTNYRPSESGNADFWITTRLPSPVSGKTIKVTALCNWDTQKSGAICAIEDDGGSFNFAVLSRGQTIAKSMFAIQLRKGGQFRLGCRETNNGIVDNLVVTATGDATIPIVIK